MPPRNSLTDTPNDPTSTSPYLEQLGQLASPVPDFAATLITQAEQDANDDNVSFLRTPFSTFHASPVNSGPSDIHGRRRSPYLSAADFDNPSAREHAERESQRRMRRAVLQHRRYTPAQLQEIDPQRESPPALRTAIRQPVGYQGWAPGTSDNEAEEPQMTLGSLRSLVRRQTNLDQESIATRRAREEAIDSELAQRRRPFLPNTSADWGQSHFAEDPSMGEPTTTDQSLRTTALLQSVRRHARFSTRSRSQLESYILERERTGHANEDRERQSSSRLRRIANQAPSQGQSEQEPTLEVSARMAAMQRARLNSAIENHPNASRWLEEAIKYLERLRSCDTYSERLSSVAEGGFLHGEHFTNNQKDFILDTKSLSPPPETSWLKAGGVFSGSQHAAGGSALPSYQVTNRSNRRFGPTSDWGAGSFTIGGDPTSVSGRNGARQSSLRAAITDDSWPVKVTINSIDYSDMTLSGTMEAFNVPRKSSPPQESSITTFLEGEIIDFNRFTLETKSFSANASIDSTYWRKLEPFKELSDKEIVRNLVSIRWLSEELGKKWILMRWKERCFVTPSDAQSGLTISGFYYVSLRRSDGHVEGLYYDPTSTPYQHLSLMPEKRMFPAYEFR